MLLYCLKCRRNLQKKNPEFVKTKNGRIMFLARFSVCNSENLKFLKKQEATELLSSLGIITPLSQIPLLGPLLF